MTHCVSKVGNLIKNTYNRCVSHEQKKYFGVSPQFMPPSSNLIVGSKSAVPVHSARSCVYINAYLTLRVNQVTASSAVVCSVEPKKIRLSHGKLMPTTQQHHATLSRPVIRAQQR
jgi:hypothetical protein